MELIVNILRYLLYIVEEKQQQKKAKTNKPKTWLQKNVKNGDL